VTTALKRALPAVAADYTSDPGSRSHDNLRLLALWAAQRAGSNAAPEAARNSMDAGSDGLR
jgi:hypothetical protein